jgi:hypothetical protein
MSTEITINQDIVEINVTEEVITIEAPSGAYPLPSMVSSVFGRVGNVVAQEGDYTLTQLGGVTITSPTNNQVLKYNGTQWVNGTDTDTGLTSVGLSMPSAFSVANSPLTANGTLSVTGAGTTAQYVRGDGSLATFPTIAQEAQRLITEVYNSTGATLTKGTVVYINGGQGNLPTVTKAIATGDATSAQTYGVVQSDITNMNNGFVVAMGSLTDLDTQIYPVGTQLYLSATTAGAWTSTKPYAPQHLVYVGIVVRSHPTQGVVEIRIQNGYELDELHDVSAQSPTNGDILQYVAATDLWTKVAGTTTNIAEGTRLYFTDARARAAISLTTTGTSGASTYNNTTGVLNIPQYQGVLTNPVTGTGTTNTLPKFTGASTIGNSNITDIGTLITLGSNTYINGNVGIGISPLLTANLYISKTLTGGSFAWGFLIDSVIQSSVTNSAFYYRTDSNTAAASFTLANLNHFDARQGSFGVGSTVTTQRGFWASNSLVGATNNYAFQGSIPSGTNRWNLFMDGTAANYLAGQLLIGTTTTSAFALDVNGTARTSGELTVNGVNIGLGAGAISTNTRVGSNALITNTTGSQNTAIGFDSLRLNTTGSFNAAFGLNSLKLNTTGSENTALGRNALENNTTGASNAGGGVNALTANTTGNLNTAFGADSLNANTTGSNNTALGFRAGRFIADGTTLNTISNNSLFIGRGTRAQADNQTNQIVIGHDVTGLGSNTTVIGNSSTTAATIFGALTANSFIPTSSTIPTNGMYLSGTNTLGFATNGTLDMVINAVGSVGIGTANLPGQHNLRIGRNISGSTIAVSILNEGITQSDVTNFSIMYTSTAQTAAAAFTLNNMVHYYAQQAALGAGSAITTQSGFWAESSLIGATNNYGFRGSIAAGTNRWNLYMDGSANNYIGGSLGIGSASLTTTNIRVSRAFAGGVTTSIFLDSQVASDTTGQVNFISTSANTIAASFTAASIRHINIQQGTFGAGSTVTNQFGVFVGASMIGATSNFGFFGDIPSGTNRWNLYMAGTANNYMAGRLGIGITNPSYDLDVFSGTANAAIVANTNNNGFAGYVSSFNSAYGNAIQMRSYGNTTASTIFGISTNGMNALWSNGDTIYAIGTIGATAMVFGTNNTERVRVKSTGQMRFVPLASDPSGAQAGDVYYNSTTNKLKVYNGTTWETITSA